MFRAIFFSRSGQVKALGMPRLLGETHNMVCSTLSAAVIERAVERPQPQGFGR